MRGLFTYWSDRLHNRRVRYLIALMATVAATVLRLAIDPLLGDTAQFVTFFVAVAISGAIGGSGPAVAVIILSSVSVTYFVFEPQYSFSVARGADLVALLIFIIAALCIAWLSGRMHAARRAARESETRLRATFDNAGVGILEVDTHDRFIGANERICRMLGYTSDELLAMNVHELTYPDDQPLSDDMNARVHSGRAPRVSYEKRYRRKDGTPFWVNVTVSAVRDAKGRYLRGIGIVEDITERKRAEAALRESEEKFRIVAENARAAFGIVQGRHFVYANPYLEESSGYSLDELLSMDVFDLVHPSSRDMVLDYARRRKLGEAVPTHYELAILTKSGEMRWMAMAVGTIHYKGHLALVGTAYDVTERKQAEEGLNAAKTEAERAKAAAEAASRAKDQFLAVLSHELRTPLTPVLAMVTLLQEDGRFDAETRESLVMVRRNIELEARLIDDLLDVTRIARNKIELNRERIDLCEIIRRAIEVCKPDIEARGLNFGVDFGPEPPYWLDADPARLQQVFWNLLKNAVKFTPRGGCVAVRCRRDGPDSVVAEVNDSGIGIEQEALDRIFRVFEQAQLGTGRQFGGLGLGLAICKALVDMHGGAICARSPGNGQGAQFTVRLPTVPIALAAGPPAGETGEVSLDRHSAGRLNILVVEDHGDTARILKRLLERRGHRVQTAGDVAAAVEFAERERFDLLVSDLGLPDGSGLELMRELRKGRPDLRGIAVSGYGMEADVQRSREAGFAEHLAKPVQLDALQAAISRVAGREHQ